MFYLCPPVQFVHNRPIVERESKEYQMCYEPKWIQFKFSILTSPYSSSTRWPWSVERTFWSEVPHPRRPLLGASPGRDGLPNILKYFIFANSYHLLLLLHLHSTAGKKSIFVTEQATNLTEFRLYLRMFPLWQRIILIVLPSEWLVVPHPQIPLCHFFLLYSAVFYASYILVVVPLCRTRCHRLI